MNYWRMQLHPSDSKNAVSHTVRSLGLGYIGLDFANPPGDLTDVLRDSLDATQRDYWEFAHTMSVGDKVLVVAHHYPCALVEVVGDYNYIRRPEEELGVWSRHFRKIKTLGYYSDLVTNPAQWEQTTMTDTISVLKDKEGASYRLIQRWLAG
jgi:hypothetical protein